MKNLMLSCLESRVENNKSIYARFLLSPFKSGDALTVGTALRRALLSQIEGIAILALDIQGITHEFSTIVGVRETVLELSLNFQRVVLRNKLTLQSNALEIGYLQIKGPAVVYANDLKLPQGVECVDPTQYIGTVSQDGVLVVKFLIGKANQDLDLKKNTSLLTAKQLKKAKELFKDVTISDRIARISSLSSTSEHSYVEDNVTNEQEKNGQEILPRLRELSLSSLKPKESSALKSNHTPSRNAKNSSSYNTASQEAKSGDLNRNGSSPPSAFGGTGTPVPAMAPAFAGTGTGVSAMAPVPVPLPPSVFNGRTGNKASETLLSKFCLQNIIPLDPLYNPVNRVNYTIQTDDLAFQIRERLVLEIWTNGSIHPRQALHLAAVSLVTLFSAFRGLIHLDSPSVSKQPVIGTETGTGAIAETPVPVPAKAEVPTKAGVPVPAKAGISAKAEAPYLQYAMTETKPLLEIQRDTNKRSSFLYKRYLDKMSLLSSDLSDLTLSLKTYVFLKQKNINRLQDILKYSSEDVLQLVNNREDMFYDIKRCLSMLGLQLHDPIKDKSNRDK